MATINVNSVTGDHTAYGTNSDDIFNTITDGHTEHQIHIYADAGNDVVNMNFNLIGTNLMNIKHGHHVFGGAGSDQFKFNNISSLTGNIFGRLDDFDPTRDEIYIDGQLLDLSDPSAITGYDVSVVMFTPDPTYNLGVTATQQWLRIKTDTGQILYALEGARRLSDDSAEENHFPDWQTVLPTSFTTTTYENPNNFIPGLYIPTPSATHIQHPNGTQGNDTFIGTSSDDIYDGNRGDDNISGGAGNDTLYGFFGNDTISGGDGNDVIEGYKGLDSISGGNGNDVISGGSDDDLIYGDAGNDRIYGGTENDTIYGGIGNDILDGGFGNDEVNGDNGHDVINGRQGNDLLRGGNGNDTIAGGMGHDTIVGGAGDDTINGGLGNDLLNGSAGVDQLTGMAGQDVFYFSLSTDSGIGAGNRDIITDFTIGQDKISFAQMDANTSIAGIQTFGFSNNVAAANSIWRIQTGSDTIVRGDVNGDGVADFEIQLNGATGITVSDFIL